jgi:hypothetical protein
VTRIKNSHRKPALGLLINAPSGWGPQKADYHNKGDGMNAVKAIGVAIVMICFSGQVLASDYFVLPKKDNIGVYRNELRKIYEEPVFLVSAGEVLMVIQSGKDHYFVKNSGDEKGWIEKQECVKAQRGASLTIDTAVINTDWDDIKTVINVAGDPIMDDDPLALDRSFKTEILVNTDQEELARSGVR